MKIDEFPNTIYVKIENDGDDDFLIAGVEPSDISEAEDTIEVGEYRLMNVKKATNKTILED
jgi:hypothetical protein